MLQPQLGRHTPLTFKGVIAAHPTCRCKVIFCGCRKAVVGHDRPHLMRVIDEQGNGYWAAVIRNLQASPAHYQSMTALGDTMIDAQQKLGKGMGYYGSVS